MKLSTRLQTVYDMVPSGIAYDVGSDHGKLIISLVQNEKIKYGYGGENKIGPYTRLKEEIDKSICKDKLSALLNDGITNLPEEVDILLLCGMGGYLINEILNKNKQHLSHVKHIIIDAHNATKEVRLCLDELNYQLIDEKIVLENKVYYEIMHFTNGKRVLDDLDLEFGPILRKEKSINFINKWTKRLNEINNLLQKSIDDERRKTLLNEKERINKVL